jgi:4-hydroxy-tetrahydrodipicolinate synthase
VALAADAVRGVIAALATPYNQYGGIDTDGVGQLVAHAIGGDVQGVLVNGAVGEAPHLSRGERLMVLAAALDAANRRVPVYAGTGAASTEETLALTQDAAQAGAAAAVVVTPWAFRLPQDALARHYRTVARRGRLPVIVDNTPGFSGNNLRPATLAELAQTSGIVALIQRNHDLGELAEAVRLVGDRRPVLAGRDSQGYPALCAGARGIVSAVAGIAPQVLAELWAAFSAGEQARARAAHWRALPLSLLLESDDFIASAKAALEALGLPGGAPRRPLAPLTAAGRKVVRAAVLDLELEDNDEWSDAAVEDGTN